MSNELKTECSAVRFQIFSGKTFVIQLREIQYVIVTSFNKNTQKSVIVTIYVKTLKQRMYNKLIGVFFVLKNVLVLGVIVLKDRENAWRQNSKYTVDQLLMSDFPKKISDDIYLDPCKAGKNSVRT